MDNNKKTKIYEPATDENRAGNLLSDWHKSAPWDKVNANAILDPSGAVKSRRITSYPSPIGQIHFYQDAFEYWSQENLEDDLQDIYYQAVSDVLDIWEIMFNWDQFIPKLDFSVWDPKQIHGLQQSRYPGHRILGNSLNMFLLDRGHEVLKEINKLYLLRYEDKLIAGTSPFTGFFLPPKTDDIRIPVPASDDQYYLETARPLHRRNPKFRAYMYRMAFILGNQHTPSYRILRKYINQQRERDPEGNYLRGDGTRPDEIIDSYNSYTDIQNEDKTPINLLETTDPPIPMKKYKLTIEDNCGFFVDSTVDLDCKVLALKTKPEGPSKNYLPGQKWNRELEVPHFPEVADIYKRILPGTAIAYPWITVGDLLEECIIQLPYKVDNKHFYPGLPNGTSAFLIPVKPLFFKFFSIEDLRKRLRMKIIDATRVRVELSIPLRNNHIEDTLAFVRDYEIKKNIPSIADLRQSNDGTGAIVSYDLGVLIFPFIRITDVPEFNDFFKVGLIDGGNDYNKSIAAKIDFFRESELGEALAESANFLSESRNPLQEHEAGSIYYEIRERIFDFMQVHVSTGNGLQVRGLIIPVWPTQTLGTGSVNVSVDLGTTNTHVAFKSDSRPPDSLHFHESDLPVVRLDKIPEDLSGKNGVSETEKFDKSFETDFFVEDLIKKQRYEFIPSILGDLYSFPLRTALSVKRGMSKNSNGYKVLGNANIAFAFNKRFQEESNWDIYTNLKWSKNEIDEARLKVFLFQLLYLIRTRIIYDGGDPRNTTLFWFFPLSMGGHQRNMLGKMWEEGCQKILKTNKTIGTPESEAPYYFLQATGELRGTTILLADIGGGTTDILIISDSDDVKQMESRKANSFTFAGDTVFGNQRADRGNYVAKNNGFTQAFRPVIEQKIRDLLEAAPRTERFRYQELEKTLHWYFDNNNQMSAEDIISFFFSQKEFEFAKKLEQDHAFKQVFMFFFTALFYHSAQVFKATDTPPPTDIYFSGNGSKMIRLISTRLEDTSKVIAEIFREVLGLGAVKPPNLHQAESPKESTSNGILYKQDNELKKYPEFNIHPVLGENLQWASEQESEIITYKKIRDAKFDVEKSEYFKFLNLYFELYQKLRFKQTFDIRIQDIHALHEQLKSRFKEHQESLYKKWIFREARGSSLDDEIEETIFFVAVKDGLQELIEQAAKQRTSSH